MSSCSPSADVIECLPCTTNADEVARIFVDLRFASGFGEVASKAIVIVITSICFYPTGGSVLRFFTFLGLFGTAILRSKLSLASKLEAFNQIV